MLYVETGVAAKIFDVGSKILVNSAGSNSKKHPFIRITDAKTRSRGGVKLLFEVNIGDLNSAINAKKLNTDVNVWVDNDFINGNVKIV